MNNEEKKLFIKKLIGSGLVVLAVIALAYLVMHLLGWSDLTQDELREFIASKGALAPIIYIVISFLQVTLVPLPAWMTILVGNYLFGFWRAFLYAYVGILAGAMFAFALGKWLGRKFVNWLVGSKERVDEWLKKLKGRENILLFFMFLLPIFPDDLLCALSGLLPMSWAFFFFMQLITRATSVLGTLVFMSGDVIPFSGWGIPVLIGVAILLLFAFVFCFKYSDKINAWITGIGDKILRRKPSDDNKTNKNK